MLTTDQRVAYLKSIDIFANTPDDVLASVAGIVAEVELVDGDTFIRQGEAGDCMYLIIEGVVRVHSGDKTIIRLGPGHTVGEFSVLDAEPRAASVTADGDVHLFRIDRADFDKVMAGRPEIAQGIIRVLVQRLRQQSRLITGEAAEDEQDDAG